MLDQIKLKFYRFLSAILLVTLISMSGVMYVSAHGGDVTLIHACVNNRSGAARIVSATTVCDATKETALDWGIQGPAGPQGPQGDKGLQGPKGDTGPAGPISLAPAIYTNPSSIIHISAEFPTYTPITSITLPSGKYILTATGNLNLSTSTVENIVHIPDVLCKFDIAYGATLRASSGGVSNLGGVASFINMAIPFSLQGVVTSLEQPTTVMLQCSSLDAVAQVAVSNATIFAIQVAP